MNCAVRGRPGRPCLSLWPKPYWLSSMSIRSPCTLRRPHHLAPYSHRRHPCGRLTQRWPYYRVRAADKRRRAMVARKVCCPRVVTAANDGAVVERCVAQFIDEPALWALQALRVSLAVLPWDPLTAGSLLAHSIHMLELAARGDAASVWPGVDTALRGAFVADPSLQGLIALASGSGAPAEIARLNVNFTMHDSPRSRDRRQGSAQRLGPCREWMRDGKCRFEKTEDGCKYPHPPRNHQWRREAPRQRASKPAQGSSGPAPAQTQAAQGGPAPDQAKASG